MFIDMEPLELTSGVWVFTSALYQTTSTVIRTEREIFVVDPNWLPEEVYCIREFVQEIRDERMLYLIFTHSDYDHIVGYGAFAPMKVIASEAFAQNPRKASDVRQAQHFDLSHYITRDYPITYPPVDMVISRDGEIHQFGETTMTFYLAPGHTDEGMFILCEPQGIWIAGDYLSDIEFPLVNGRMSEYRSTLAKVHAILGNHKTGFLIPGHGSVSRDNDDMLLRRDHASQYLADIESLVIRDVPFPEALYRERYPFWEGIRDWHDSNITHLKEERLRTD